MKKTAIIILVVTVSLLLFNPFTLLFLYSNIYGFLFVPNLPQPEITSAEFPFALEYEVDGVYHKYEDILVCEYKGTSYYMETDTKKREWTSYYKSGNQQIVLYKDEEIEIFFFPVIQKNGNADAKGALLMGDMNPKQKGLTTFPDALYKDPDDDNYRNGDLISAEDLLSKYNIRLISWECAPPIKNTFK